MIERIAHVGIAVRSILQLAGHTPVGEGTDELHQLLFPHVGILSQSPNDQLRRPIEIVRAVELGLQCPEQGVIFQPACLFEAILLEGRSQFGLCPGIEVTPSPLEKAPLERDDGAVFDRVWRERDALAVARFQQSIRDQKIRADQELVASKRR